MTVQKEDDLVLASLASRFEIQLIVSPQETSSIRRVPAQPGQPVSVDDVTYVRNSTLAVDKIGSRILAPFQVKLFPSRFFLVMMSGTRLDRTGPGIWLEQGGHGRCAVVFDRYPGHDDRLGASRS